MMKKSVKKRVQEAMKKYKPETENVSNEQPVPQKPVAKQTDGFIARPNKKRG